MVVIISQPKSSMEAINLNDVKDRTVVKQLPTPMRKSKRKSQFLVPEVDNEGESSISISVQDPEEGSELEPSQLVVEKTSPNEPSPVSKAAATLEHEFLKAPKRRRRTTLEILVASTEQDTLVSQQPLNIAGAKTDRRGRPLRVSISTLQANLALAAQKMRICAACGAREPLDAKWLRSAECDSCVGKHATKPTDNPIEIQNGPSNQSFRPRRSMRSNVVSDGPVTIVDMAVIQSAPAPQAVLTNHAEKENITPQRQSALKARAVSSGKRSTRAVLFAPEAEIIPGPEAEDQQ